MTFYCHKCGSSMGGEYVKGATCAKHGSMSQRALNYNLPVQVTYRPR
jgi:hypothetical protein